MLQFRVETADPDQTAEWGRLLAGVLRPGDLIRLDGPLGAGKTTLVRAIAEGLGADPRDVSSPTFVLANEYRLPPANHLVHIDAYRIGTDDLDTLGWDRFAPDDLIIIEWAERIADALPADAPHLAIEVSGEHARAIDVTLPDTWRARPDLERLGADLLRCPKTDLVVSPADPFYPFASERARMADLHTWITGGYRLERPIEPDDLA